jgi:O-antigen ligase
MRVVLAIVFLALILKDTSYLGDHYILRGLSQGLCLGAGLWWLVMGPRGSVAPYAVLGIYGVVLVVTAVLSREPVYVALQVGSLGAVLLFFVAYHEMLRGSLTPNATILRLLLVAGTLVLVISVVGAWKWPDLAYLYDPMAGQLRFRGLFGQPGMMGSAAGLMWGVAVFGPWHWTIKGGVGALSLVCVALTSSRTFWVAWLLATLGTWWWTTRGRAMVTAGVGALLVVLVFGLAMVAFGLRVSEKTVAHTLRTDSIENLTGRTKVWKYALSSWWDRPLFGYGFTTGDEPFNTGDEPFNARKGTPLAGKGRDVKRYTLHNGYIQALLDSGAVGAALYVVVLGLAIIRIARPQATQLRVPLFILLFAAIANMGETIIFSAATFQSVLVWYCVVFGLSLAEQVPRAVERPVALVPEAAS